MGLRARTNGELSGGGDGMEERMEKGREVGTTKRQTCGRMHGGKEETKVGGGEGGVHGEKRRMFKVGRTWEVIVVQTITVV